MSESPHIEDDDRDDDDLTQVVSYLDGELDDTAMLAVEQQLVKDPDLRNEADALSRTWAMLDELEEVAADKTFTQQTLNTIAAAEKPTTTKGSRIRFASFLSLLATHRIVPSFALGLLGGLLGITLSSRPGDQHDRTSAQKQVNQTLLQEFDLLRNASMYSAVPDAERLRALSFPSDGNSTQANEEQPDE